jgi:ribonuclease HII
LLDHERQAWATGVECLAGVDEAGRGPLAGPVAAAAVIIERSRLESEANLLFKGLTDSKKLSRSRREYFFELLLQSSFVRVGIGLADVAEIDSLNILNATHLAMARAVQQLNPLPDHVLVDGLPVKGLPCPSTAIVKGDALSLSIAAASIVAKVTRDRLMVELDRQYPQYGFARHMGYGTAEHLDALRRHGPSPCHRRSFAPVSQLAFNF